MGEPVKLGDSKAFKQLQGSLMRRAAAKDPTAFAQYIGRKRQARLPVK